MLEEAKNRIHKDERMDVPKSFVNEAKDVGIVPALLQRNQKLSKWRRTVVKG